LHAIIDKYEVFVDNRRRAYLVWSVTGNISSTIANH